MENIMVERDMKTSVLIENEFKYEVLMDIDLTKGNDYQITITFEKIEMVDLKILNDLFQKPAALKISSPFFKEKEYNISYIVIEKISIPGNGTVIWNCLSDEPIDLEIK